MHREMGLLKSPISRCPGEIQVKVSFNIDIEALKGRLWWTTGAALLGVS
jgi:hypothetical protein